jgi:hypothetical protein
MSVQHPGTAATAGHRLPGLAGERLLRVQPDQSERSRALRPTTSPICIEHFDTAFTHDQQHDSRSATWRI